MFDDAQVLIIHNLCLVKLIGSDDLLIAFKTANTLPIKLETMVLLNDDPLCYSVSLESTYEIEGADHIVEKVDLRAIIDTLSASTFELYGKGLQQQRARLAHQYCGQCGGLTLPVPLSASVSCNTCNVDYYPRISPCIMVLITHGPTVLLAHHTRSRLPVYTALAGFVEPGESLEQTVHREVKEEVGLRINNLHYFSSQCWPFPSQLMVAFTADYHSGELMIDDDEIKEARWFSLDALPTIPSASTLSGQLIRAYSHKYGSE